MKRFARRLSLAIALTVACSAYGQGTVLLNNNSGGLVKQQSFPFDLPASPIAKGGGFVQLAFAPVGTRYVRWQFGEPQQAFLASNPGWTLLDTPVSFNTPSPGRFNGGVVTLAGISPGNDIEFVLFGWTGTNPSFDVAMTTSECYGVSSLFTCSTGAAGTPPSPPVPLASSFTGMLLIDTVPEPSSLGVTLAGIAAIWVGNRHKRNRTTKSQTRVKP